MASLTEVKVPDIGDFTDVPIVEILVAVGDEVEAEQPLLTLESDKAAMDVPAPGPGKVAELKVAVGDKVSEGTLLAMLEPSSGDGDGPATESDEAAAPEERDEGADAEPEPEAEPAEAEAPAAAPDAAPPAETAAPRDSAGPVYAGPGARRRARELGVDLASVKGTGRKGRITVEDVEAGEGAEKTAAGTPGGFDLPPWPTVDFEKYGPVERRELPKIRQISGANLQRNWITIPHVTHHDEADITELEEFRKRTNEELADKGVKLTMVALLLKACVASLKEFPEFNSSIDGTELVVKGYYNLGFAADTPAGLVVPVIKDVDRKGLAEIATELSDLSGKAREGKLGPAQMAGGTFTISSLGGIGGTAFTPIVNAPEVAILGVTRSRMQPVWNGSEFEPRLMVPLDLSYDHRVIDGAAAARFVAHLAAGLSDMRRTLL